MLSEWVKVKEGQIQPQYEGINFSTLQEELEQHKVYESLLKLLKKTKA